MATQTDYAWAAGFFDGEGCVSLHTQRTFTVLRLVLVQKDIRPLEHFKAIFESSERIGTTRRADRKHTYYRLTYSGDRAADVLQKMLPYLTLKREVAQVGLDLQANVNANKFRYGCSGMPPELKLQRAALVDRAKWLNTGRWAAAETKPSGPLTEVCDSPNCSDGKATEVAEMATRLAVTR